jgi:hypothetical protein
MATRTPTYITGTVTGQAGSGVTFLDNALNTVLGVPILATALNRRIYGPFAGNGFCLAVDDNAGGAAAGREMTLRLCEATSTIGALVNPAPTVAQRADITAVWRKSNTADATARNAYFVGDDRGFELFIMFGGGTTGDSYRAGDALNGWTGDAYNSSIWLRTAANGSTAGQCIGSGGNATLNGDTDGPYFLRNAAGTTTSVIGSGQFANGASWAAAQATYPHPMTTKLHMSTVTTSSSSSQTVTDVDVMPRGYIPFIFDPHVGDGTSGIASGDTFTDTAYDATSEFIYLEYNGATNAMILQIAGTYDPKAAL